MLLYSNSMSCLTASTIASIQARITTLQTRLIIADEAYDSALIEIEEYRLDTGVGSQRVRYRKLEQLQKAIDSIEARINSLQRRLLGKGISNMALRRKGGFGFRGSF